MKLKSTEIGVLILAIMFVFSIGGAAHGMMGGGSSGGQSGSMIGGGPGGQSGSMMGGGTTGTNTASRFSGFGTVTAIDTTNNTITVELTMASRLISVHVGSPFEFEISSKAWIGTMAMGGMMSQSVTTGHTMNGMGGSGSKLTLSSIKEGDSVSLMGYLDSNTNEYIVDRLFVWVN